MTETYDEKMSTPANVPQFARCWRRLAKHFQMNRWLRAPERVAFRHDAGLAATRRVASAEPCMTSTFMLAGTSNQRHGE